MGFLSTDYAKMLTTAETSLTDTKSKLSTLADSGKTLGSELQKSINDLKLSVQGSLDTITPDRKTTPIDKTFAKEKRGEAQRAGIALGRIAIQLKSQS